MSLRWGAAGLSATADSLGLRWGPADLLAPANWPSFPVPFFLTSLVRVRRSAADVVGEDADREMAALVVFPLACPGFDIKPLLLDFEAPCNARACGRSRHCGRSIRLCQGWEEFLSLVLLGLWKVSLQRHAWAAICFDAIKVVFLVRNCGPWGVVEPERHGACQDATSIYVMEVQQTFF